MMRRSDNYDEADLMEIDRREKDAMCEQDIDKSSSGTGPDEPNPEEPESDLQNRGFALESCLQPVDISEDFLCFSDSSYCVAPAERKFSS